MATVLFSNPSFVMDATKESILAAYVGQAFPAVDMAEFRQLVVSVVAAANPGGSPYVKSQLFLQHTITPEQLLSRLENGQQVSVNSVSGSDVLVVDRYEGGIVVDDGQGGTAVLDTQPLRAMICAVFGVAEIDAYNVAYMSFSREYLGGPTSANIRYRKAVTAAELAAGIESGQCDPVLDRHPAATSIPPAVDPPELP